MSPSNLKLYIWHDVFCDWTCGIAFAIAENPEHAKQLIEAKSDEWERIREALSEIPEEHLLDEPFGHHIRGGG